MVKMMLRHQGLLMSVLSLNVMQPRKSLLEKVCTALMHWCFLVTVGLQSRNVHLLSFFVSGNRRSTAGNFEYLTETLREARMRELALEERKIKLEEDKLQFEREKWAKEQRQQEQQQQHQQMPAHGACQYVSLAENASDVVQSIHYFAADDINPVPHVAANECVLAIHEM